MIEHSPLSPDRFFAAEPGQRKIARQLYASVLNLPLVCPCVNLNPELFADPANSIGDPCDLLVLSDENILRRLKSQGLNIEKNDQVQKFNKSRESENRKIWHFFVENSFAIRGIPADIWISEILYSVFGIKEKLVTKNAQRIYDAICENLQRPEFRILKLLERFNIEILGVVDSSVEPSLNFSQPVWAGKIIPCMNVEPLFQVDRPDWIKVIHQLSESSQITIEDFPSFVRAIQKQRLLFKTFGATTVILPMANGRLTPCQKNELDAILKRGFLQVASYEDSLLLMNQMVFEMTMMSLDDGMVLQVQRCQDHQTLASLYLPSINSINRQDIAKAPGRKITKEFSGGKNHLSMIHFPRGLQSLDEIEDLVDEFPFSRIGVPTWFFNGLSNIKHYFDNYVDNFGWYRTAGFNNMTSSILALPSQNDIWRRASANWLAGLVVNGLVDLDNAYEIIYALAYSLVKSTYNL